MSRPKGSTLAENVRAKALVEEFALTLPNASAPQIHRMVEAEGVTVPDPRTVSRWAVDIRERHRSEAWSLLDDDTGYAGTILPVLGELLEEYRGAARMTRAQAAIVVRVARAAPDMEPHDIWSVALAYQAAGDDAAQIAAIDRFMALSPWRDAGARYAEAIRSGWIHPWALMNTGLVRSAADTLDGLWTAERRRLLDAAV